MSAPGISYTTFYNIELNFRFHLSKQYILHSEKFLSSNHILEISHSNKLPKRVYKYKILFTKLSMSVMVYILAKLLCQKI